MSDWQLWLFLIVLLAFLVWWWWSSTRSRRVEQPPKSVTPAVQKPVEPVAKPAEPVAKLVAPPPPPPQPAVAAVKAEVPDDLTIVEGIGPKTDAVLKAAGIQTLAELSVTDAARLREILRAADLRLGDPTTWPEQAALAAAGKLEELQALQATLKGGRRV